MNSTLPPEDGTGEGKIPPQGAQSSSFFPSTWPAIRTAGIVLFCCTVFMFIVLTRLAYLRRRKLGDKKQRNRSKQTSPDGDDSSSISSLSTARQKQLEQPKQAFSIEAILLGKSSTSQGKSSPSRSTLGRSKSYDVEQGVASPISIATDPMTPSPNKGSSMDLSTHSAPFRFVRQVSGPSEGTSIRQERDRFFGQMKDDVPDDTQSYRSQLEEACGSWLPFQFHNESH